MVAHVKLCMTQCVSQTALAARDSEELSVSEISEHLFVFRRVPRRVVTPICDDCGAGQCSRRVTVARFGERMHPIEEVKAKIAELEELAHVLNEKAQYLLETARGLRSLIALEEEQGL